MPGDADYMRMYMRHYRARGRDRTRVGSKLLTAPFVGVDGEGGNLATGYHAYFLLRAGDRSLYPSEGNARLTSWECLDFISSLDPGNLYVSYFFDYDSTKIVEDLGWTKLRRLMTRALRTGNNGTVFPVDYREFQVDYLPRKYLKVRKKTSDSFVDESGDVRADSTFGPWVEISDVGSFFQCSFLQALENWGVGTPTQRAAIKRGKDSRASFSAASLAEIEEYNALEISLLQTLMDRFRDACESTGYLPSAWQGPGLLAESMFKAHGVPRSKDVQLLSDDTHTPLLDFARSAFYGGRPEISVVGPVDRPVYQWDINSAYPHGMRFLPCLQHGQWKYNRYRKARVSRWERPTGRIGEKFALQFGTYNDPVLVSGEGKRPLWYGFPFRTETGTIQYPAAGRGWYWSFEAEAAIHQTFYVEEEWVYERVCTCVPLSFVVPVYDRRQQLGKDGPGIVLKLALNSLYGKTVQSIGSPKYSNAIWGSFITAFTRTQIQDFIHASPVCKSGERCGSDILMVATDSVMTLTERSDVADTKELGGWSVELHPNGVFIVQPGLYFGSSGKPSKTRGVPRTLVDERQQEFRDAYARMVETRNISNGCVRVPQTVFVGVRYALHRHNLKLLGQWIEFVDPETKETGKSVSFDWTSKRAPYPVLEPLRGIRSWIQTFPPDGDTSHCTLPYDKDIGGVRLRETLRLQLADQPDWITPLMEEV